MILYVTQLCYDTSAVMERCGITGKEYSECYSDAPKLIDFFKSEMPLREDRHMGTQEYLCGPGSQQWRVNPAASPERAIADCEERQVEPILVDFFKDGNGDLHLRHHGVEAPVINRSSSSFEVKQHPMPTLKLETGERWNVHVANPLQALKMPVLSPSSTGTAESGTAAPKTPTCDMEIAYSRPYPDHNESSAHQGSTVLSHGCSKLLASGEFEVCADSGTSHGRLRTNPAEGEDEETEAVVQAATSLLSLASSENTPRRRRRPRPDVSSGGSPVESDRELDEAELSVDRDGACSSVLYRPTNKRRYKLLVDLLAETPTVS